MSAQPIEWHEECLCNMDHHVRQVYQEYIVARNRWQRTQDDIDRLRRQIARARRLGKTRFDAERFRDTD